jgi:cell division protein FtsI/penicillin-binding protein 2
MVQVIKIDALLLLVALALAPAGGQSLRGPETEDRVARNSLFAQSAAQLLQREFQNKEVSFLLLDARTGTVMASRWDHPEQPIPLGSLIKPFIALAYGEEHQFRYPAHVCKGESGGCWLPRGHGEIDIAAAVANSCNSYFRMLTANMTSADVVPFATRFGFEAPGPELSGPDLIGVGNRWLISPLHLARAYLELNRRRDQPGAREVIAGMAQSARQGTGSEVGRALRHSSALVKTGTAACTHHAHAPGDGFVVALAPAEQPEFLLMVRVHGVPGAKAAVAAGRMLSRIEE